MKPDNFEGLVEFEAEQLWLADAERCGQPRRVKWAEAGPDMQERYRFMARKHRRAEYEAGIVACPVLATEEMVTAGALMSNAYDRASAVIAASPYTPKGDGE